ncbi:MAG TPA: hypothetical protein VJ842_06335 [Pyrinomonadaceae bacterium]|nr:hypothetical protein [Pyrinomonadaceae bacterium]
MRDRDAALGHHLDEVAVAQLIGAIPADAENNDCAIEVAATEEERCVRKKLVHVTDYPPDSAFAPEPSLLGTLKTQSDFAGDSKIRLSFQISLKGLSQLP